MEKRFFIDEQDISSSQIILSGDEHLHLSKVLRLRVGDNVECFYNNSNIFNCQILSISKNNTTLEILSQTEVKSNPKTNVTLFQALPKLDKLELITQKVTELGISTIIPFSSTFCIAKQNDKKNERLKKIVISACKQCGRTNLTEIKEVVNFNQLLSLLQEYSLVIFANETENAKTLKQVLSTAKDEQLKSVALVVGSEGGFSKQEIESLMKLKNAFSITMGQRILRTETASIALSSIVLYELNQI